MLAFSLDSNSIFNGVVVAFLVWIAAVGLNKLRPMAWSIDTKMTIRMLKRDRAIVSRLARSPSAVTNFVLIQMMWVVAIASVGGTFCGVAFLEGNMRLLAFIIPITGLSTYGVAIYTLGLCLRSRNSKAYLDRIDKRMAALVKKQTKVQDPST